ncbi:AAA family ATPase [Flavobacterium sp. F-328]|uniref:AAA family ATPase n=1 Tax=Flavobacterium erciyesense TaxID=2825842 RepID=A0ABS5D7Q0_9FLAO|nr:AAA family ATPase [Flavobacterium erciyesense]MBQ0910017.1 AAA family ATPase [Flavobacterium erciyesense]
MIKSIHIKNFKSIVDLKMDLGSFNVLIGENGAGKSNILEGIGFGAAASANKLDFEFLGSRGIRLSSPESMISAFNDLPENKNIDIAFVDKSNKNSYKYSITHNENNKWVNNERYQGELVQELIESLIFTDSNKRKETLDNLAKASSVDQVKKIDEMISTLMKILDDKSNNNEEEKKFFFNTISNHILDHRHSNDEISNFIVFSPEQSSLRKFEDTTQIYPLGIKGEGIFQYLKKLDLSNSKDKKLMKEIKENMLLLDWYENFEIPNGLLKKERSLSIKDRFLKEDLNSFDQRSTNEGFLFLLFYSVLFCSSETPTFFAIDNIDSGLNPKLTMQLIQNLAKLAKKHKKQVIVTTHSPAVLDGLDLEESSQRLFVVKRNDEGFTTAKRVTYNSERRMKLSEIWTNGFIGGLPENF